MPGHLTDRETGTLASSTMATVEVLGPPAVPFLKPDGKSSGTVTKVTTTHTTTKIVTTKMAIGDEHEITALLASQSASGDAAQLGIGRDESASAPSQGARKVSFPQEPLSSRGSSAADNTVIFAGKFLKYGFRLFKNNWHPVHLTLSRDGTLEWTNADAADHSHTVKLKELPAGLVVIGRACLEIPAYLSPKLAKGTNAEHLVAVGRRDDHGKLKSYWFLVENVEALSKFRAAVGEAIGPFVLHLAPADVRKVWMGQGDINVHRDHGFNEPVEPVTFKHHDSEVADEAVQVQPVHVQTPRRPKSAKEAFFAS